MSKFPETCNCELCECYVPRVNVNVTENGYLICSDCEESDERVFCEWHGDECFLYVNEES